MNSCPTFSFYSTFYFAQVFIDHPEREGIALGRVSDGLAKAGHIPARSTLRQSSSVRETAYVDSTPQPSNDAFHASYCLITIHCVLGSSINSSGLSARNSAKAASTPSRIE